MDDRGRPVRRRRVTSGKARHQRSGVDTSGSARHQRYTAGVQRYCWYRPQIAGVRNDHLHLAPRRSSTAGLTVTQSGDTATPAFRRRYLRKCSTPAVDGWCPAIPVVSATHRWYPRPSPPPERRDTCLLTSIPAERLDTSVPAPTPGKRLDTSGTRLVSSDTAGIGHKPLVSATITITWQLDGRAQQASPAPARHQWKG